MTLKMSLTAKTKSVRNGFKKLEGVSKSNWMMIYLVRSGSTSRQRGESHG